MNLLPLHSAFARQFLNVLLLITSLHLFAETLLLSFQQ